MKFLILLFALTTSLATSLPIDPPIGVFCLRKHLSTLTDSKQVSLIEVSEAAILMGEVTGEETRS